MNHLDIGAAPFLVAVFAGAWVREKAPKIRLRNAALVSVMALLCGVASIFGRKR